MIKERMELLFIVLFANLRRLRSEKLAQVAEAAANKAKQLAPVITSK